MNSLEWPNQASQQNNLYKIWKSYMIFLFFVRYKIIFGLSLLKSHHPHHETTTTTGWIWEMITPTNIVHILSYTGCNV